MTVAKIGGSVDVTSYYCYAGLPTSPLSISRVGTNVRTLLCVMFLLASRFILLLSVGRVSTRVDTVGILPYRLSAA